MMRYLKISGVTKTQKGDGVVSTNLPRITTGVPGFDEILHGGLPSNHVYLLDGSPGSGKTTFCMQFLLEGVRLGEKVLYLTLLHDKLTIDEMAVSHGWDMTGVEVCSLLVESMEESLAAEQTLLSSSEVQLTVVMDSVKQALDRIKPKRVVFDSIEQFRLLAGEPVIYRQKILALQRLIEERRTTAIFVEASPENAEFKTLAHGVIVLDTVLRAYGNLSRRIQVEKMRGVSFHEGYHSFSILTGGIVIFPRLQHTGQVVQSEWVLATSGIAELDAMLDGGLAYGSSCLIVGQAGTGKSTLAIAYVYAEAKRGKHAAIFLFDERIDTFLKRSKGLGMDPSPLIEQGLISVERTDSWDLSAGEFAKRLKDVVEQDKTKIVVIDSLTGYASTMRGDPLLLDQLNDMMTYLGQQGVLSLMTTTEHGIIGTQQVLMDASYIADAVVLLRRFEAMGTVRLAMSVIKKRYGNHEKSIRELKITSEGLLVGQPLTDLQGVLTGMPVFVGSKKKLIPAASGEGIAQHSENVDKRAK
jgi:circadian clock protein KaiC